MLTGPLRHAAGSPGLGLLRVLRHAPTATADSAPAPSPPTGLGGHRRDVFPRSLIRRSAGLALSCTPEASPRATATPRVASAARPETGRPRRSRTETGIEHPQQPIAANSGLLSCIGASDTGSSPTPFCLASGPSPLAADRSYVVEGRLLTNAAPPTSVPPSGFTRPLRRPGAGSLTPPGHMAPRGAVLVRTTRSGLATAPFNSKQKRDRVLTAVATACRRRLGQQAALAVALGRAGTMPGGRLAYLMDDKGHEPATGMLPPLPV